VELLLRLHWRQPSAGWDAAALLMSERARAQSLLEMLAGQRMMPSSDGDPPLPSELQSLQKDLEAKERELMRSATGGRQQRATTEKEYADLVIQYEELIAQQRNKSSGHESLLQPKPLNLLAIQKTLDSDTMLLEYFLGDRHSYLFAVTQNSLQTY